MEFWPKIFKAPWHGQKDAAEINGSLFRAPKLFLRKSCKIQRKTEFFNLFFQNSSQKLRETTCPTISDGSLWPKECCGRENLDCCWRKTQLFYSGPKTKGYKTLVLAFFMDFSRIALKFWPDFLHAPWNEQNNATEKKKSRVFLKIFGALQ